MRIPFEDRCRRCAFFYGAALGAALLAATACADTEERPAHRPSGSEPRPQVGDLPSVDLSAARVFYGAYLTETLRGDVDAASAGYRRVPGAPGGRSDLQARASVRLAALRAAQGREARATELIASALAVAVDDPELLERADRLRARLTASSRAPLRGPAPGTEIAGLPDEARRALGAAEKLLVAYYRRSLSPRLDTRDWVEWATSISKISVDDTTLRATQSRLVEAVRAYNEVANLDPRARVAAEFRVGALYHDSAIGLFDLPPELDSRSAARLRFTLRRRAMEYLRRARAAYARSIETARSLPPKDAAVVKRWMVAAQNGLKAVDRLQPL